MPPARGRRILPIRLTDTQPTGALEYQFSNAQFIDAFDDPEGALDRLAASLRRRERSISGDSGSGPVGARLRKSRRAWLPLAGMGVAGLLLGVGGFAITSRLKPLPPLPISEAEVAPRPTASTAQPHPVSLPTALAPPAPAPAVSVSEPLLAPSSAPTRRIDPRPDPAPPSFAATAPEASQLQQNLGETLAQARWSIGGGGGCARAYEANLNNDRLTWTDWRGGTDVEAVRTISASGLASRTLSSDHPGQVGERVGTLWSYQLLADGRISVARDGQHVWTLTRC